MSDILRHSSLSVTKQTYSTSPSGSSGEGLTGVNASFETYSAPAVRLPDGTRGRTLDISGDSLGRFLSASQLAALLSAAPFVAFPLDGFVGILVALSFASLVTAAAVGLWRATTGRDGGPRLGTAEDITYGPFADPEQAAKDRWEKAVSRLPGGDDSPPNAVSSPSVALNAFRGGVPDRLF